MGLFGDFFDFDGDGKVSRSEELLGFALLEEFKNKGQEYSRNSEFDFDDDEDDDFDDEYDDEDDDDDKYEWRDYRTDGIEYGIFPEDYETEDEYDEALAEAQNDELNE